VALAEGEGAGAMPPPDCPPEEAVMLVLGAAVGWEEPSAPPAWRPMPGGPLGPMEEERLPAAAIVLAPGATTGVLGRVSDNPAWGVPGYGPQNINTTL